MILYLVAVPIGNLKDITLRAIEILRSVDFIIAEDTRYSLKLLNHLDIRKKLVSYYRPMESRKVGTIINMLKTGDGALITDSGTPLISDPGFVLLEKAIEKGVDIVALPGPTAFVPALVASGISPVTFVFLGFPPRKKSDLTSLLADIAGYQHTLVFYESPRRVKKFLETAGSVLGNRRFCLAKEISKKHEKIIRGQLGSLDTILDQESLLGEMVIVIQGAGKGSIDPGKPQISSREDIYRYFRDKHDISKNSIKRALMRK